MPVLSLSHERPSPSGDSARSLVDAGTRPANLPPDPELHRHVTALAHPVSQVSAWDGDQWLFYLSIDTALAQHPDVRACLDHLQRVCQVHRRPPKVHRLRLRSAADDAAESAD